MAGADVADAGAVAACPRCGATVKLHSMVPVLAPSTDPAGDGGDATGAGVVPPERICVVCARSALTVPPVGIGDGGTTLDHDREPAAPDN